MNNLTITRSSARYMGKCKQNTDSPIKLFKSSGKINRHLWIKSTFEIMIPNIYVLTVNHLCLYTFHSMGLQFCSHCHYQPFGSPERFIDTMSTESISEHRPPVPGSACSRSVVRRCHAAPYSACKFLLNISKYRCQFNINQSKHCLVILRT